MFPLDTLNYTVFSAAIDKMLAWIGIARGWKNEHDAKKQEQIKLALQSLIDAALETRQYLATARDNSEDDSKTRIHLASLWGSVGFHIWPIDPELAQLYLRKADYWSDPVGWTQAQKDDREIQLDEVYKRGQEALKL